MIYGIGVDTASAARLEKSIASAHFVQRVFGPEERALLQSHGPLHRAQTAAANFAAKEALAKALEPSDEIQPAATEEQIASQESVLDFTLPAQVREFFLLTAGIQVSTGVILSLSGMFDLTIHGERYCVLGEFWKEADGDQLLLRPGEETIWYYAHEQDKVKRLCNDMTELLEKKLARYLNEQ